MRVIMLVAVLAMAASSGVHAASPGQRVWEQVRTERSDSRQIVKEQEIEVRSSRGVIIVSSSRAVQIKVFTILGQLVSSETLPAGVSELQVNAHGVYIVKVGDLTCKVTI